MAGGHVNHTNRPNTWLLQPCRTREKSLANPEPFPEVAQGLGFSARRS